MILQTCQSGCKDFAPKQCTRLYVWLQCSKETGVENILSKPRLKVVLDLTNLLPQQAEIIFYFIITTLS